MDWKINVRAIKRKIAVVLAVLLFFSVIPEESLITLANPAVAGEEVSTETVTDGNGESVTEEEKSSVTDNNSEKQISEGEVSVTEGNDTDGFKGMMFSTGPDYGVNPIGDAAQLEFDSESVVLYLGSDDEVYNGGFFEYDGNPFTYANKYVSSDTNIVEADNQGKLTPIAPGTATITAEYVEEVDSVETVLAEGTFEVVVKGKDTLSWSGKWSKEESWNKEIPMVLATGSQSDGEITYTVKYTEQSNYTVEIEEKEGQKYISATGPGTIEITAKQEEGTLYYTPNDLKQTITLNKAPLYVSDITVKYEENATDDKGNKYFKFIPYAINNLDKKIEAFDCYVNGGEVTWETVQHEGTQEGNTLSGDRYLKIKGTHGRFKVQLNFENVEDKYSVSEWNGTVTAPNTHKYYIGYITVVMGDNPATFKHYIEDVKEIPYGTTFSNPVVGATGVTYRIEDNDGSLEVNGSNGDVTAIGVASNGQVSRIVATIPEVQNKFNSKEISYKVKAVKGEAPLKWQNPDPVITFNPEGTKFQNTVTESVEGLDIINTVYDIVEQTTLDGTDGSIVESVDGASGELVIKSPGYVTVKATVTTKDVNGLYVDTAELMYTLKIEKAQSDISFAEAEVTVTAQVGPFLSPQFINYGRYFSTHEDGVRYFVKDPEEVAQIVADIDKDTGLVTLGGGAGEVTIYATLGEDDYYAETTVSYTLIVEYDETVGKQFYLSVNGERFYLIDGKIYLDRKKLVEYDNDWFTGDVMLNAEEGYQVSVGSLGNWDDSVLLLNTDGIKDPVHFWVKDSNGITGFNNIGVKRDATNPTANITLQYGDNKHTNNVSAWNEKYTFVNFAKAGQILIDSSDATSGVAKVEYFIDRWTSNPKESEYELKYEDITGWERCDKTDKNSISLNEWTDNDNDTDMFVVYAKVTDKAGNVAYTKSNVIILDENPVSIELEQSGAQTGGSYTGDITINIDADENSYIYSGLKNISYYFRYKDNQDKYKVYPEGAEPIELYKCGCGDSGNPIHPLLRAEKDMKIDISADEVKALDKFNDVQLVIIREDHAGNRVEEGVGLPICVDAPTVEIEHDSKNSRGENVTCENSVTDEAGHVTQYYQDSVGVNLVITTKEYFFREYENAIEIKITDENGNSVSTDKYEIIGTPYFGEWNVEPIENKSPYCRFHKRVFLKEQGIYNVELVFKANESVIFGTKLSNTIVIDNTAPTGEVTVQGKLQDEDKEVSWNDKTYPKFDGYDFKTMFTEPVLVTATKEDALSPIDADSFHYYVSDSSDKKDPRNIAERDWKVYDFENGFTLGSKEVDKLDAEGNPILDEEGNPVKEIITQDTRFTVYFRVKDRANNTTYFNTNGCIVDSTPSKLEIKLVPDVKEGDRINVEELLVSITADEDSDDAYSGIAQIKWWMTETKNGTTEEILNIHTNNEKRNEVEPVLYEFHGGYHYGTNADALKKEWTNTNVPIRINAKEHNSDDLRIHVQVTDNAGNVYEKEVKCSIDTYPPIMQLRYLQNGDKPDMPITVDGDIDYAGDDHVLDRGYFDGPRCLLVMINERANNFDGDKALQLILDSITATTIDTNEKIDIDWTCRVTNDYREFDNWNEDKITWYDSTDREWAKLAIKPEYVDAFVDTDIHGIYILFNEEANYTIDREKILYTDEAGLKTSEVLYTIGQLTPFYFTVDYSDPEMEIQLNNHTETGRTFRDVGESLTYESGQEEVNVTVKSASDITSPYKIFYYVDESKNLEKVLTEEELNTRNLAWCQYNANNPPKAKANEYFKVYFKIWDYAGHTTYMNADGYIVDTQEAEIDLTLPEKVTDHGDRPVYNSDIPVSIEVTEPNDYSGIALVEYWVTNAGKETQRAVLYQAAELQEGQYPAYADMLKTFSKQIVVDSVLNNGCDILLNVRVLDRAGNESLEVRKLDIDITKPVIQITYDNNDFNKAVSGREYYPKTRTATVVITERTGHFEQAKATAGIDIVATDIAGFVDDSIIGQWATTEHATDENGATHTAKITYAADGNYIFSMSYTDLANNSNVKNDSVKGLTAPYLFTVDTNKPTGTVKVSEIGEWKDLIGNLTFGLVSRVRVRVSGTAEDKTSPLEPVLYYKTENTKALTAEELDQVTGWKEFNEFDIDPSDQFTIYKKLTDYAGNVTYISTDGVILDDKAPNITINLPQAKNGIYGGDVTVTASVEEQLPIYSGIKEISYQVLNMGVVTQEKNLYVYDIVNPEYKDLVTQKSVEFVVSAESNNSNEVLIKVTATDNAGNTYTATQELKIDITAPVIDISYDNNNGDTTFGDKVYFKENRTATVSVKERNFDPGMVSLVINNEHGVAPTISSWHLASQGTGNKDGNNYVATVTFAADGDYTFEASCQDMVGNPNNGVGYGSSLAPKAFTIDKTAPEIEVSYDNNDVKNNSYYKGERVATIRVREHNFETSRIVMNLSAMNDGKSIESPVLSSWSHNGDVHTATIHYSKDALYSFEMEYVDMAGNPSADMAPQSFFVDTTNPVIEVSGIVDESANNSTGNIGFVISATDNNFDIFIPEIQVTYMENGKIVSKNITDEVGEVKDITKGKEYVVTNLKSDGIYKVKCTVMDKAGNVYTVASLQNANGTFSETARTDKEDLVIFSVNRNGSTFDVNEFTRGLVQKYYVKHVPEDVVIYEINTDKLSSYSVTLNGKELTENKDYFVKEESAGGNWKKYSYTISKSVFEKEGEYRIVIASVDKAGNNTFNDVTGVNVAFVVDRTAPVVTVSGMTTNGRYQIDKQIVKLTPKDDGGALKAIYVYLVDEEGRRLKELLSLSGEELEKALSEGNGDLFFEIGEGLYQNIQIICEDYAMGEDSANVYNNIFNNVSVSSSAVKILWANKGLRYGIFIGLFAVAGGFFLLLFYRRKRKNK